MLNNQLSSSQINETLLNAMKMIAQKEVQDLEFDVTEKYTILEKTKDKNGETCYIINMNNIKREVYPMNNEEYYPDDVVLIQIPKNNILEKKYILGLANSATERCFLPSSNFIPLLSRKAREIIINKDKIYCSFSQNKSLNRQVFSNCNAIYVKCDFKINDPKNLNYEYGIVIKVTYLNNREIEYYLKSDSFIGNNPLVPYYFTQDILFDNIKNFNNIKNIVAKFYTQDDKYEIAKNQISARNLKVFIGKSIADNDIGLEIISKPNSLDYNDAQDDFRRDLGLIWYNRNSDGDFVGFSEQTVKDKDNLNKDILTEVPDGQYKNIITDEYDYIEKKKIFNERLNLYNTNTCPFDLIGLDLIHKINTVDQIIVNAIGAFLKNGENISEIQLELKEMWNNLVKLISPDIIIKDDEYREASNLPEMFIIVQSEWENFNLNIITKQIEQQSSLYQRYNEQYNLWNEFIGTMFYNVHKMQQLDINLNLESLKIKTPTTINGQFIDLEDIIISLRKKEFVIKSATEIIFNSFSNEFIPILQGYIDYCKDFYQLETTETKFNDWINKIKEFMSESNNLFQSLINEAAFEISTPLKKIKEDDPFEEFWNNSSFINTEDYEKNSPYYNFYYSQYKNYREDVINGEPFQPNYSLIPEKDQFIPEFELDETTKNKFSLYWYEEDLNNNTIDPLLNEDGWSRIDNEEYLTFPEIEKPEEVDQKKYYLTKASPYERMLSVTLPKHLKTKAYKVVLYYNHEFQSSAEITFNNKSYVDIGFENSLIDLEYGKTDIRSLPVDPNTLTKLPLSIICYNEEKSRNPLEEFSIEHQNSTPKDFPTLQAVPLLTKNKETPMKEVSNDVTAIYSLGREGEKTFVFESQSINPFVPFGIYRFKLWLDAKTTMSAYYPFSWNYNASNLVLSGAKMVSVNKNKKCTFDSWKNNESIPKEYSLTGEDNIRDLSYNIYYYKNSGGAATKEELLASEGEAFTILKNNDAYQLQFNVRYARNCLKLYRPVLVIEGTHSENQKFKFYQSLFIEYSDYDYDTDNFTDEENGNSPTDKFIFIDPQEAILAIDLRKIAIEGYSFLTGHGLDDENKALRELNRILTDPEVLEGYKYYFEKRARRVPSSREVFEGFLEGLKNKTLSWDKKIEYEVIPVGASSKQRQTATVSSWIADLFKELMQYAIAYDDNKEFYISAKELSYEDVKKILEKEGEKQ